MTASQVFQKGIALDIDDTIADTSRYAFEYLRQEFSHDASVEILAKKYGYPHLVPEWQLPACIEKLRWLHEESTLYELVQPISGAVQSVRQLHSIVPIQCYITSRLDQHFDVTTAWLKKHDFPNAPVICRTTDRVLRDWKIRCLVEKDMQPLALVDNELYVPADLDVSFSLIELIHYHKISPEHPQVQIIESWERLIEEIKKM